MALGPAIDAMELIAAAGVDESVLVDRHAALEV